MDTNRRRDATKGDAGTPRSHAGIRGSAATSLIDSVGGPSGSSYDLMAHFVGEHQYSVG